MGQIVCQTCGNTVDHFEDDKVTVLYGKCPKCHGNHHDERETK